MPISTLMRCGCSAGQPTCRDRGGSSGGTDHGGPDHGAHLCHGAGLLSLGRVERCGISMTTPVGLFTTGRANVAHPLVRLAKVLLFHQGLGGTRRDQRHWSIWSEVRGCQAGRRN